MKRLVTNMDMHGRMLIPAEIREKLNIQPGDKVNIEVHEDEVRIINSNHIIDEMYNIFTKNQNNIKEGVIDDFISSKHEEYQVEESRGKNNV